MTRDYEIVSPSLIGIMRHDCVIYDGIKRPIEISQILDRPTSVRHFDCKNISIEDRKNIENYFQDLYGILIKKISEYVMKPSGTVDESVRLQAMLQELIKVKKLL